MERFQLFIDLDGVLVDFNFGVREIFDRAPEQLSPSQLWSTLARTTDYYATLPWTDDGKDLWEAVKNLSPTILTGLPRGKWAEPQKRAWCRRELGADVPVITCMSRDKHLQAKAAAQMNCTALLVDDRASLAEQWELAGGIFITHTSASQSIQKLSQYFTL